MGNSTSHSPKGNWEVLERLAEAIKKAGGQTKVSSLLGIDTKTVGRWSKGQSAPKFEDIVRVAKLAGVSIDWIAGESEGLQNTTQTTTGGALQIPRYPISASAGHGRFLQDATITDYVPFPADFFKTHVRGNPDDMFIINASGDSMEPTMRDGDMIMIDKSAAEKPINAGIYCFSLEDLNFVKRLQQMPQGILARSDNKDYSEFLIEPHQQDEFHPIGRVVWIGRTL